MALTNRGFAAVWSPSIDEENFARMGWRGASLCDMRTQVRRPLSISILGWLMLVTGSVSLPMAFLRVPLSFFGLMLGGWIAAAGILGLALAYLVIGFGLLRLNPEARAAGIALFVLLGVNALVISFIPGTHTKMLGAMKSTPLFARQADRPAPPPVPFPLRLLAVAVISVPVWFLVTRKKAFEHRDDAGASAEA